MTSGRMAAVRRWGKVAIVPKTGKDKQGNRGYSIYSIKDGGERRARGISELRSQESTPWTHKSFIYKQGLISQAGRRGFESGLPLHVFIDLRGFRIPSIPPLSRNS